MERHAEVAAEFSVDLVPVDDITWHVSVNRSNAEPVTVGYLELKQGRFRMLWIDEDGNGSSVLYESPEAAAGGVARWLLEGQPFTS
jgi:hypothetical protein